MHLRHRYECRSDAASMEKTNVSLRYFAFAGKRKDVCIHVEDKKGQHHVGDVCLGEFQGMMGVWKF